MKGYGADQAKEEKHSRQESRRGQNCGGRRARLCLEAACGSRWSQDLNSKVEMGS